MLPGQPPNSQRLDYYTRPHTTCQQENEIFYRIFFRVGRRLSPPPKRGPPREGRPGFCFLCISELVEEAVAGGKRLCTRHSVRLDQLIDLISDRIRYYVQTYYQLDPKDLQRQKDTRRDARTRGY